MPLAESGASVAPTDLTNAQLMLIIEDLKAQLDALDGRVDALENE